MRAGAAAAEAPRDLPRRAWAGGGIAAAGGAEGGGRGGRGREVSARREHLVCALRSAEEGEQARFIRRAEAAEVVAVHPSTPAPAGKASACSCSAGEHPGGDGLRERIDSVRLHPVTVLASLHPQEQAALLRLGVVLCAALRQRRASPRNRGLSWARLRCGGGSRGCAGRGRANRAAAHRDRPLGVPAGCSTPAATSPTRAAVVALVPVLRLRRALRTCPLEPSSRQAVRGRPSRRRRSTSPDRMRCRGTRPPGW